MILTKFQVNSPFGSGEEVKKRFSRWPPWQPSWISNRTNFSFFFFFFFIYQSPLCFLPSSSQLAFRFRRRSNKQIFKMATMVAILDFQSENFLAIFNLQITPKLPSQVGVNWPFSSEKEVNKANILIKIQNDYINK